MTTNENNFKKSFNPASCETRVIGSRFKPILFSTPMVQAILDARKTQTRRVVKSVPKNFEKYRSDGADEIGEYFLERIGSDGKPTERYLSIGFPKYTIGDILWVRETWQYSDDLRNPYLYKQKEYEEWKPEYLEGMKWKPSIFMPKEACRIFLKVTDVRVERLNDIALLDCKKEGVIYYKQECPDVDDILALEAFMELWQKINGEKSWDENPFVWVYTFERIERPHDFR